MAEIKLQGMAHSYLAEPRAPADYALKALDFAFRDGGAYALLGPSGCGKTTLLNVMSGLIAPSRGRVLFGDRDVTDLPTEARNIAQVFQFPVVYDTMTVRENLAFPLRNRRLPASEIAARVEEIAAMLDLGADLNRKASGLTADAKQKISLGRGLVRADVAAILFDEPLTVIDPHLKWELRSKLKQLHQRFGHTMIYVTHDQTEALTFADQVVVMFEGEVVQIGSPEDLFLRPAHVFVGHFIGSPGMNVLPARVAGNRAIVNGADIPLAGDYAPPADSEIAIGIRPEFVRLGMNGTPVKILRLQDVGRYRIAALDLAGAKLNAIVPEGAAIPTEARIAFDPAHIHVYAGGKLLAARGR